MALVGKISLKNLKAHLLRGTCSMTTVYVNVCLWAQPEHCITDWLDLTVSYVKMELTLMFSEWSDAEHDSKCSVKVREQSIKVGL